MQSCVFRERPGEVGAVRRIRGLIGDEFGFGREWKVGEVGRPPPLQLALVKGRVRYLHIV